MMSLRARFLESGGSGRRSSPDTPPPVTREDSE
jgi:hypothetical protein